MIKYTDLKTITISDDRAKSLSIKSWVDGKLKLQSTFVILVDGEEVYSNGYLPFVEVEYDNIR